MEANVEALWQEQLAKNPRLFNGSKFRLAGYSTEGDRTTAAQAAGAGAASPTGGDKSDSSDGREAATTTPPQRQQQQQQRPRSPSSPPTRRLRLRLGLTDYRTFRGEEVWGERGWGGAALVKSSGFVGVYMAAERRGIGETGVFLISLLSCPVTRALLVSLCLCAPCPFPASAPARPLRCNGNDEGKHILVVGFLRRVSLCCRRNRSLRSISSTGKTYAMVCTAR